MKKIYKRIVNYPTRRLISRLLFKFDHSRSVYRNYTYSSKCIFIHIPKSAGKSIAMAVYGSDKPGHYFAKDYLWCDRQAYKDSFKFCFVRDPVTRFISAYNFLSKGGTAKGDMDFKHEVIDKYKDINHFVMEWVDDRTILMKEHFLPQVYFTHVNGENSMDFLGKYENIDEDYRKLRARLPFLPILPKLNKSQKGVVQLTPESIKRLKEIYSVDYEAYGYHDN